MRFTLILLLTIQSLVTFSQKDTIVTSNGDVLIGELKRMERGELTFDTDYANDEFNIEWSTLLQVRSPNSFLISLSNSERIESRMSSKGSPNGEVELLDSEDFKKVKISEIVFIKPIDDDFESRFGADVSVGANKTKSQNLLQITGKAAIDYSGERYALSADVNTLQSKQDDTDDTERTNATVGVEYYLQRDWFADVNTNILSNTEQQVKLRNTTKAGAGKYIFHTNQSYLSAAAGLAYTFEKFDVEDQDDLSSFETFAALEFDLFNLDKVELETEVTVFPGISEDNRFRTDITFDLKYDLPFDLFIDLSLQYNYDNQVVEDSSKTDYVVQTTVGWEF